ncbi:MAG: glycosyl hydrolase [Verrucomicrobia bacterium]|jgi:alpha-L-fucosidase|nr:glycosyl hydrolase [Verrucomicrobiota bacterium]
MTAAQRITHWIILGVAIIATSSAHADTEITPENSTWPYEHETREERDERMGWWREARFGMFIHWGVYSVPAGIHGGEKINGYGEWIMSKARIPVERYREYAAEFNPVKYDPDAWVRLAKQAGMKYIVITAKHHDGFALYDSRVSEWDIADATPYKKDLLRPLAEACRKHGLKLGFYYSHALDFTNQGGAGNHWDPSQHGDMKTYLRNVAANQAAELLTEYDDLAIWWWDMPVNMDKEKADMLQPLLRLRPGIIVNNRLGGGYRGDTDTPEQNIPGNGYKDRDWETCMTLNHTWGYKSWDDEWKSTETLIHNLIDIASKGGNYLLNVGPTALGEIPQPSVELLKEVGAWMDVNSESIYGTQANPLHGITWGRCTRKVDGDTTTYYLHVFDWPADGTLQVPGLAADKAKVSAKLLANGRKIATSNMDDYVTLSVGNEALDPIATVIALKVSGEHAIVRMPELQDKDGVLTLRPQSVEFHDPTAGGTMVESRGEDKQFNIGGWTAPDSWIDWRIKLNEGGRFTVQTEIAGFGTPRLRVTCGNAAFETKLPKTGAYGEFAPVTLGEIELPAGTTNLALRPVKEGWLPINIRRIMLRPVE